MTKLFVALLVAYALIAGPVHAQPTAAEPDFLKEGGQACVFGAAVLGTTSLLVLYPALMTGTSAVPVGNIVLGNTLFGCGIAAVGMAASYGFTWVYDTFLATEPETATAAQ